MTTTLYNTAYLARRLGISQAHLQRLVKQGKFLPDHRVKGIGTRPPQYAWTEQEVNQAVTFWREQHGELPT